MAIFPPLSIPVLVIIGLALLSRLMDRRARRRAARAHRATIAKFYQTYDERALDRHLEEQDAQRTFTNPGWRV